MACSTLGGTDTFYSTKLVIFRPYFSRMAGLTSGSSASPSSPYFQPRMLRQHRHVFRAQAVLACPD